MNVELALRVKEKILKHPRLCDMRRIGTEDSPFRRMLHCGTVGCIAGHTLIEGSANRSLILAEENASMLLGLSRWEGDMLFYFYSPAYMRHENPYYDLYLRLLPLNPGSRAYAKVVAEAIDRCIERNTPKEDVATILQREANAERQILEEELAAR